MSVGDFGKFFCEFFFNDLGHFLGLCVVLVLVLPKFDVDFSRWFGR